MLISTLGGAYDINTGVLLKRTIALDLIFGITITLIILWFNPVNALIYFIGIIAAVFNFAASCFITTKLIFGPAGSAGKILGKILNMFRITLILLVAVFFIKNVEYMGFYLAGLISHLIMLCIAGITKTKKEGKC